MERVLGIDASGDKLCCVLFEFVDNKLSACRSVERSFTAPLSEALKAPTVSADTAASSLETNKDLNEFAQMLSEAAASLNSTWSRVGIIVPALDFISLNISLPFKDDKNVSKVLVLEVQERLPFDINNFFIAHRILGQNSAGEYDIHVGLLPRDYLNRILAACHLAKIEPNLIAVPGEILVCVRNLSPEYFNKTAAFIYNHGTQQNILFARDGQAYNQFSYPPNLVNSDRGVIIGKLKLALSSFEREAQREVERVYLLTQASDAQMLQSEIGRPVETLRFKDFLPNNDVKDDSVLAALAALAAKESAEIQPLINFRTGEFRFNPKVRELLRALKDVLPFLYLTIILVCAAILITHGLRVWRVNSLRSQLVAEIQNQIPDIGVVPVGQELALVQNKTIALENKLKELGSLSALTPLDVFLEVSKDLSSARGIKEIGKIYIRDNRVRIEGLAKDYATTDRLDKLTKRKKTLYCKREIDNKTSARGTDIGFTMQLKLCEQTP